MFDCGANVGIFTAIAASNPQNYVYAFEPIPSCMGCLEKISQKYKNVKIVPKALMDVTGSVRMTQPNCLEQSRTVGDGEKDTHTINVMSITIDEFVEEHNISKVDYIKADIEGAERKMLIGAKQVLKEFAPTLSICTYHLPDDPEVLEMLIKESNPAYHVEHKKKKLYAYVK